VTIAEFITQMEAIVTDAETAISTAETFIPSQEVNAALNIAEAVLPIAEQIVSKALTAWSQASGQAITVASVTALLPDSTPLPPPTE
jgi:hypothetical protein